MNWTEPAEQNTHAGQIPSRLDVWKGVAAPDWLYAIRTDVREMARQKIKGAKTTPIR